MLFLKIYASWSPMKEGGISLVKRFFGYAGFSNKQSITLPNLRFFVPRCLDSLSYFAALPKSKIYSCWFGKCNLNVPLPTVITLVIRNLRLADVSTHLGAHVNYRIFKLRTCYIINRTTHLRIFEINVQDDKKYGNLFILLWNLKLFT